MEDSENLVKKKLIGLTGGTGFIGRKILEECLISGYRVRVLTRNFDYSHPSADVESFVGDLRTVTDWSSFVDGVDCIVNAAGEILEIDSMHLTNCEGPELLFNAAIKAKVGRWVQLSSVGAYGKILEGEITENFKENPTGIYELSKENFDRKIQSIAQSNSLEYVIVRPSIVYGVGMSNLSLKYLMVILRKRIFAYIGPRGASANYIHIDDLACAIMLCIDKHKAANQIYIVSDWATIEEMVEGMCQGLGISPPFFRIPLFIAFALSKISNLIPSWPLTIGRVEALTSKSRYVSKKIETDLKWHPKISIPDGMKQMTEQENEIKFL